MSCGEGVGVKVGTEQGSRGRGVQLGVELVDERVLRGRLGGTSRWVGDRATERVDGGTWLGVAGRDEDGD